MKKHEPITPVDLAFIEAFLSPEADAMNNFLRSQGIEPGPDDPIDLRTIPKDQWEPLTKIIIPPAMQRYLDTEDELTAHATDMMELALERFYQVEEPWVVIAETTGLEADHSFRLDHFYIDRPLK